MNTSNSDIVIGTSNLPHSNVQNNSPFNTLITLQKLTDIESSVIINDEITDKKYISEEVLSHQNSAGIIYHTCDDNGINVVNIEWDADITYIHAINEINDIYMNDAENYTYKYYAPYLSSKNHEAVYSGTYYYSEKRRVCHQKTLFWIYY